MAAEAPVVRSMRAAWAASVDGNRAAQAAAELQKTFDAIASELAEAAPDAVVTHALPGECTVALDGSPSLARSHPGEPPVGVVLLCFDDGSLLVGVEPGVPHFFDADSVLEVRLVTRIRRRRWVAGLAITYSDHGAPDTCEVLFPGVHRRVVRQLVQPDAR